MGFKTAYAAFDIPELFKADVSPETTLSDVVIKQLQPNAVANDGGLPYSNIGKWTGMHHAGLILHGAH
ncbi:hypothetical protein ES703_113566 [subsurface metagenome]